VIGTATVTLVFAHGQGLIDPTTSTFQGGPTNATNDANLGGGTVVLTDDKGGPVVAPTVTVGPPTVVNLNNNGVVTGYVHIAPSTGNQPDVPDQSKPGLGNCVTQITVAGDFVIDTIL
jgi:hypothetical protein